MMGCDKWLINSFYFGLIYVGEIMGLEGENMYFFIRFENFNQVEFIINFN